MFDFKINFNISTIIFFQTKNHFDITKHQSKKLEL